MDPAITQTVGDMFSSRIIPVTRKIREFIVRAVSSAIIWGCSLIDMVFVVTVLTSFHEI